MQAADGNFYGTTSGQFPRISMGNGSVFQMTPAGVVTTLHDFSGADGSGSLAALVQGADGNLYGTTWSGGATNRGTVFSITPTVPAQFTTIYSFCTSECNVDGYNPAAPLVQGSDGNFYGTTQGVSGSIFKITPAGALTTLYQFFGGPDGGTPLAGLVQGSDGNFYGTTSQGGLPPAADGTGSNGTTFQITPAGILATLYSFTGGFDGASPQSALVQGADGNFYGTTSGDANSEQGTVFKLWLQTFTISGQITDSGGNPLSGVFVTDGQQSYLGTPSGYTTTDASGNYSFTEPPGGNYTVTPVLSGDTFSPASKTFNNLSANQTQNFTASAVIPTFALFGQVTLWAGTGVSGVTMTLSGSQSGVTTTDGSGNYSFSVSPSGNYTLTPSLSGYAFSPASQTASNLTADQYEGFVALPPVTISGQVTLSGTGLGGVTMTLSGPQSSTTITDASGNYSFSGLPYPDPNSPYKVTPSLSGDSFSPPSQIPLIANGVSPATENFAVALGGAATFHLLATLQGGTMVDFPQRPWSWPPTGTSTGQPMKAGPATTARSSA
jgi:uncharacterized repeat protein (TIGR03803 family)